MNETSEPRSLGAELGRDPTPQREIPHAMEALEQVIHAIHAQIDVLGERLHGVVVLRPAHTSAEKGEEPSSLVALELYAYYTQARCALERLKVLTDSLEL